MTKLPTLLGAHHVGITVEDLDAAVEFLTSVLGLKAVVKDDVSADDPDWFPRYLGAEPGTRLKRLAILPVHGVNIELLEYEKAGGLGPAAPASAQGATHLALSVGDIDAAVAHLRERGVDLLEGPSVIESGDLRNMRWVYFRTPWGVTMELVQNTNDLGYMQRTADRLWDASAAA